MSKPGSEPQKTINSVSMCAYCFERACNSGNSADIGVCFNCGRWACTCLLSEYPVEGEAKKKLWCAGHVPGGCDADGKTEAEDA